MWDNPDRYITQLSLSGIPSFSDIPIPPDSQIHDPYKLHQPDPSAAVVKTPADSSGITIGETDNENTEFMQRIILMNAQAEAAKHREYETLAERMRREGIEAVEFWDEMKRQEQAEQAAKSKLQEQTAQAEQLGQSSNQEETQPETTTIETPHDNNNMEVVENSDGI
jgi:hypothetical protein